jgi:hypothetical protein
LPTLIPDDGLLAKSAGSPLLYAAHYAAFHLESLEIDDVGALEEVHQLLIDYIGTRLRWSWSTVHAEVEPFRPTLFEYASQHPLSLRNPHHDLHVSPEVREVNAILDTRARDQIGFAAHGGSQRNHASPFSYRFFCKITGDSGAIFPNASMLSFTVPHTAPPKSRAVDRE